MSGLVATCAGSTGGSQPPSDPTRLPSHCQFAPNVVPRRRDRGKYVGRAIAETVQKEGKLLVLFDDARSTCKALANNGRFFNSSVSLHTRDICDPHHSTWKEGNVDNQQPKSVIDNWVELHQHMQNLG
ncbi:hypothetical protein TIFTF001_040210 [Ficus carica]|uniref:Uncharacterized protein n=1 Tax=Ficus carica TaxID=3494 RepID=A0AA87ZA25_FICCA|nr:hypothetical protein TIFTF001_040210 [Ficus carica]